MSVTWRGPTPLELLELEVSGLGTTILGRDTQKTKSVVKDFSDFSMYQI